MNRSPQLATTVFTAFAAFALANSAAAADWKWNVTPYAWATDVGIDVKVDDR